VEVVEGALQLPFSADQPGGITGWMLSASATASTGDVATRMKRGFDRLASIPAETEDGHDVT
jgi:hypothetical protein